MYEREDMGFACLSLGLSPLVKYFYNSIHFPADFYIFFLLLNNIPLCLTKYHKSIKPSTVMPGLNNCLVNRFNYY